MRGGAEKNSGRPSIVFDIGNVIRSYDPVKYLKGKYDSPDHREILYRTIFLSPEWVKLDAGTMTTEAATEHFCQVCPELAVEIRDVMSDWFRFMHYIPETVALIRELACKGYSLYYLSNMHEPVSEYIQDDPSLWSLFCGGLFSWETNQTKPDKDIFHSFFARCGILPESCVFLDDSPSNVEAARSVGMTGILYDEPERAIAELNDLLSKLNT